MNKWLPLVLSSLFILSACGGAGSDDGAKTISSGKTPVIGNLSGSAVDGGQITISGSDFGINGPNIILFEDFKRGTDGAAVDDNATIGRWAEINSNHPPYYGTDSAGNVAGHLIKDERSGS